MRILGLDLGTNSVGWAFVETAGDQAISGQPKEIHAGVYVFPEAVDEKADGTYESLRHQRGTKRRMRRNLARKRQRVRNVARVLRSAGMLPAEEGEYEALFHSHKNAFGEETHPYALRRKGLGHALTLHELGRCFFHIARRRGYLSTAQLKLMHTNVSREVKEGSFDRETTHLETEPPETANQSDAAERKKQEGPLLKRIRQVREDLKATGARTLGEYYAMGLARNEPVRGIGGKRLKKIADELKKEKQTAKERGETFDEKAVEFGKRADRQLFEDEFKALWDKQREFHAGVMSKDLRERLHEAIFDQRPLRSPSWMVGKCEFEKGRRRAARATLLAQRTVVLQYLNTLRLFEPGGEREGRKLLGREIRLLANELDRQATLSWDRAKKLIGCPDARFSDEREEDSKGKKRKGGRGRDHLVGNKTAAAMRRAIGSKWMELSAERQDDLVTRLLTARDFSNIEARLRKDFGLTDEELAVLAEIDLPEGHMNHCSAVLRKLEPFLLEGHDYWNACVKAGYRQEGESTEAGGPVVDRLHGVPNIPNPIVQRSVKSAFKVINAVIARWGKPDRIRIEMPRDVSKTNQQRKVTWEAQEKNQASRDAVRKLLQEHNLPLGVNERNVKKVRLWIEAGCRSPYDPDREISIYEAVNDCDIDHIVPRSRSLDDSWGNLAICPFALNAEKTNKTPYEAWGHTGRWERIEAYLASCKTMERPKKQRILRKEWEDEGFTNRALSDTRYLSRVILTEVKRLYATPPKGAASPVEVSRGQIVALLRDAWELGGCVPVSEEEARKVEEWQAKVVRKQEKPRFDHRHHALDAILVALTDRSTFKAMTDYFKQREEGLPSNQVPKPKPWPTIRKDLTDLIKNRCPVVFAPTRSISGPLHEETARRPPSRERVEAALAALPPDQRARVKRCVVVGKQLVWFDREGNPTKAYDLGSNHHAVIWERLTPDKRGNIGREFEIVSMMEAARRARHGEPVFQTNRPGYRHIMSLCKNDVVEWTGENPGLKRIAKFAYSSAERPNLTLRPLIDARANKATAKRVTGRRDLELIARRVVLNPIGEIVASEP